MRHHLDVFIAINGVISNIYPYCYVNKQKIKDKDI